jgi:phosphate transport system substrate-binding protein
LQSGNRTAFSISTITAVLISAIIVGIIVAATVVLIYGMDNSIESKSSSSIVNGYSGYPSSLPTERVEVAGSSLLLVPLEFWARNFTLHYPNVEVDPSGGGSGYGQSGVETGSLDIGDSDAYLTNQTQAEYPNILDVAVAVSAQQINYNLPNLPGNIHLNFSGSLLTSIYNGTVAYWDDPAISAINPGAARLNPSPFTHHLIVSIHRADSSGDTFIFTQYLSKTDTWWRFNVGFGTSVSWPADSAEVGVTGNSGMVAACHQNPYSVAYIGVSYLLQAIGLNEGYAYLENQAGNFVNISQSNIASDVNAFSGMIPNDERISLVFGPGQNSYPIVNFEYMLIKSNQSSSDLALVIRTFVLWVMDPKYGNSAYFLKPANFVPLPSQVYQLSVKQVNEIHGS